MSATSAVVHTPVGLVEIKTIDGTVVVTRIRATTSDEQAKEPGHRSVQDIVSISFPRVDEPVIQIERRSSTAAPR